MICMCSELLNVDWNTLEGCTKVNEVFDSFYNVLKGIFERSGTQYISNDTPVWYNITKF